MSCIEVLRTMRYKANSVSRCIYIYFLKGHSVILFVNDPEHPSTDESEGRGTSPQP